MLHCRRTLVLHELSAARTQLYCRETLKNHNSQLLSGLKRKQSIPVLPHNTKIPPILHNQFMCLSLSYIHFPFLPLHTALSSLTCPSALFGEQWRTGSSECLKGSEADVEQNRKNALTSSFTTSILSILHLSHPTTPPSGHITTITSTDTTNTVPDVSELWITGRSSHEPLFC